MGLFLVLYGTSLFLPGLVAHTYAQGHDHETAERAIAFLEQGQRCWTADGPASLNSSRKLIDARGVLLPNPPPVSLACHDPKEDNAYFGWWILLIGWAGGSYAWFANIFVLVAVLLSIRVHKPDVAGLFAFGAIVLGLDALDGVEIPSLGGPGDIFDHLAVGYYVWEASLVVLLLDQFVRANRKPEECPISGTKEH